VNRERCCVPASDMIRNVGPASLTAPHGAAHLAPDGILRVSPRSTSALAGGTLSPRQARFVSILDVLCGRGVAFRVAVGDTVSSEEYLEFPGAEGLGVKEALARVALLVSKLL